jgi:hypothetical protein
MKLEVKIVIETSQLLKETHTKMFQWISLYFAKSALKQKKLAFPDFSWLVAKLRRLKPCMFVSKASTVKYQISERSIFHN